MAMYENDWATEAIAKQFLNNKRKYAYKLGDLDVPDGYDHLVANSAKRNPAGSRKSKAALNTDDMDMEELGDQDDESGDGNGDDQLFEFDDMEVDGEDQQAGLRAD
jgi:hypothetical protein